MKICGIKMSHDAAVAVIEDGKLLFCTELEKVANGARYTVMKHTGQIARCLSDFGLQLSDIDNLVVDGWKFSHVKVSGEPIPVASYHEFDSLAPLLTPSLFPRSTNLPPYSSYKHVAGHVVGAYVTSPFAKDLKPSYVLTWDGGVQPRVHYVNPAAEEPIKFVAPLFELYGTLYTIMGLFFGPYKEPDLLVYRGTDWRPFLTRSNHYDIPGKLMSYISKGKVDPFLLSYLRSQYFDLHGEQIGNSLDYRHDFTLEFTLMSRALVYCQQAGISDEDALMTTHHFQKIFLLERLRLCIPADSNLCFTGGAALNIKWNSALRASGHFAEVWVPPFPNDCGNAIGAAACEMVDRTDYWALDWDVYSGPPIRVGELLPGWHAIPCTPSQVGYILAHNPMEPIVVLIGRAELGPRALGHRSILASPKWEGMKALLNSWKRREDFRPVAPICMEEYAPDIFDPGTPDPYMLFDHKVRAGMKADIPAVLHIDGTARLQTISAKQCPEVYAILSEHYKETGIPLLCNTSANLNGSGFFPDVASAMLWGKTRLIYSEGMLYERKVS
jgi:carbamoyltransferase